MDLVPFCIKVKEDADINSVKGKLEKLADDLSNIKVYPKLQVIYGKASKETYEKLSGATIEYKYDMWIVKEFTRKPPVPNGFEDEIEYIRLQHQHHMH